MKIGDKVRFLNDKGGGIIVGFKGNNIVLVEDEDGFEVPTLIREVAPVVADDYSTSRIVASKGADKAATLPQDGRSIKAMMQEGQNETVDMTLHDEIDLSADITYKHKHEERKGGNKLSACLAILRQPESPTTHPQFELYLINDSNYSLRYTLLAHEGNACTLFHEGEAEPNTCLFISELTGNRLSECDRFTFQAISYKRDQSFVRKNVIDTTIRMDATKLFKPGAYTTSPYFEEPALLFDIITDDVPARPLAIDPKALKAEMYAQVPANDSRLTTTIKGDSHTADTKQSRRNAAGDAYVYDLHATALLDSTDGMANAEILERQLDAMRQAMNEHLKHRGHKLIFIHGKGDGVLRQAVLRELRKKYPQCQTQDASFREYGYGATQVTIK